MIINKDINPQKDLYYIGALLIDILNASEKNRMEFFQAFQFLNKKDKISIGLFTLAIDWLFLLDLIRFENGELIKCF